MLSRTMVLLVAEGRRPEAGRESSGRRGTGMEEHSIVRPSVSTTVLAQEAPGGDVGRAQIVISQKWPLPQPRNEFQEMRSETKARLLTNKMKLRVVRQLDSNEHATTRSTSIVLSLRLRDAKFFTRVLDAQEDPKAAWRRPDADLPAHGPGHEQDEGPETLRCCLRRATALRQGGGVRSTRSRQGSRRSTRS